VSPNVLHIEDPGQFFKANNLRQAEMTAIWWQSTFLPSLWIDIRLIQTLS
jgi:hypothetical protein